MIWYKFVFVCIQNLLKPFLEGWGCQNADNINRGRGLNYYIGRWGSSFLQDVVSFGWQSIFGKSASWDGERDKRKGYLGIFGQSGLGTCWHNFFHCFALLSRKEYSPESIQRKPWNCQVKARCQSCLSTPSLTVRARKKNSRQAWIVLHRNYPPILLL